MGGQIRKGFTIILFKVLGFLSIFRNQQNMNEQYIIIITCFLLTSDALQVMDLFFSGFL